MSQAQKRSRDWPFSITYFLHDLINILLISGILVGIILSFVYNLQQYDENHFPLAIQINEVIFA